MNIKMDLNVNVNVIEDEDRFFIDDIGCKLSASEAITELLKRVCTCSSRTWNSHEGGSGMISEWWSASCTHCGATVQVSQNAQEAFYAVYKPHARY